MSIEIQCQLGNLSQHGYKNIVHGLFEYYKFFDCGLAIIDRRGDMLV